MKKNVGIINFHYSKHNYGAVLQAAALSHVIENHSIDVEHINYIPKASYPSFIGRVKELLLTLFTKLYIIKLIYKKPLATNYNVFENFRNKWLRVSSYTYMNKIELYKSNLPYTHVIVGSDQVWRVSYTVDNALVYFLDFCDSKIKKISYAASFGIDKWEDSEYTEDARLLLQKFDSISVREHSGINICKQEFGVDAIHVLDPTLLAGKDFFEKIISSANSNKNITNKIVYYKLDVDNEFKMQVENISNILKCDNENIYYKNIFYGYKYNTVYEWLAKISSAELIITDSFHCICLSILFNKEFVCISNKFRGNSRLDSLFEQLGITGHVFNEDSEQSLSDFVSNMEKINYSDVNQRLGELRKSSMKFLLDSLT
ncbi:polysaccharide pyruvyl transferase family protein [Photobacterium leiognathi]|uniref:polysaccharide pyruvyl transferase family protein n=1 Tax=Photobacterium leiognathi TaxID=553611 RepID=UPI002981F84D|nr:polysaccharide pyruvyl transferase family protein [Photobacterium leiognathi]